MSRRRRLRRLADAAPVFAALGDPTRLGLVAQLSANGPMSIVRLTEGAHVTRQAVTKHLLVLADAGLVRGTREGRDHIWEIEPTRLDEARRWLDQALGASRRRSSARRVSGAPNRAR